MKVLDWIKKYKIIIDLLVAVIVGVAGIFIACQANRIANLQYILAKEDTKPVFYIDEAINFDETTNTYFND